MFRQIKHIFFDADDTLYHLKFSIGDIYAKVLARHGVEAVSHEFDSNLKQIWPLFEPTYLNAPGNYRTDQQSEKQRWLEFIELLLGAARIRDIGLEIYEELYEEFRRAELRTLEPHIEPTLRHLKDNGFRLHVLSNHDRRMKDIISGLGLSHYFEHVIAAEDLGWKKPSSNFFKQAATLVGCHSEEAMYIGNNLALDYHAARQAGWQAILYANRKVAAELGPKEQVRSFADLSSILVT